MGKEVGRLIAENELTEINREDYYIKIRVDFGPRFSENRHLSRAEFLELLKKDGRHYKGFLGPMFQHFAEHIEVDGELDKPADLAVRTVYYGCNSCVTDGKEGSLCQWNDGSWHCDAVC